MNYIYFIDLLCSNQAEIIFEKEPTDTVVYIGETAFFNCSYSGTPDYPIWIINGSNYYLSLPPNHFMTETFLMVTNVSKINNQTTYQCVAFTKHSTVGRLTVLGKHTERLFNLMVEEG